MSSTSKQSKPALRRRTPVRPRSSGQPASLESARLNMSLHSPADAEATVNAIRAGQVDALVIQSDDSEELYALRTFEEIAQTQAALENAGAERKRSHAQLRALSEERERLFQDMHDGCIQSIYAVGLNLEACMKLLETNPKKATAMVADATASLNLVIQELRSFITGHRQQIPAGKNLRTEIQKAVRTASNHGLTFTVDIDDRTMSALTGDQAMHLLQIAREGISNAVRHASARTGHISLQRKRGIVRLEIFDDGSGFIVKKVNKCGLGLHHIHARAQKVGGTARVSSKPSKGTQIVVEFGASS
jgi:signal transduction histidine kinase